MWKSLTVYISSGGLKLRAQELGSHRTVAGAARCNPQDTGSNPVQGGLEEKRAQIPQVQSETRETEDLQVTPWGLPFWVAP
ncbi:MAG: hypothetical protein IMF03_04535 [Proteobacteria bacterium]|nr:hypothetical protein [Pseudomonadota bacterium]